MNRVVKQLVFFAILGGLLTFVGALFFQFEQNQIGGFFNLAGVIFILLGLVGLYLLQAKETGVFGFISFLVLFIALALVAGAEWMTSFVIPVIENVKPELLEAAPPSPLMEGFMITFISLSVGAVLFGLLVAIKGILPRLAGVLVLLGGVADLFPLNMPISIYLFGLGFIWLGWAGLKKAQTLE
jgi:hypothetical protein